MPFSKSNRNPGSICRQTLSLLLLAPTIGCVSSTGTRFPWSSRAVDDANVVAPDSEEEGRVASAKRSPFSLASIHLPVLPGTATLTDDEQESVDRADDPMDLNSAAGISLKPMVIEETTAMLAEPIVDVASSTAQSIDLATALGMAGGNAWTIQLARQRTVEAHADLKAAKAMWLPSLQFGVGWNKHDGRLQETEGEVLQASRGSFFTGGGTTFGAPIAGGTNGPLRLSADLALADAYFAPQIASRQVYARRAGISVARNQALLDAGLAYIDLLDAAGQVADEKVAVQAASELLTLTQTFADAGAGALADVDRAATQHASLNLQLQNANRLMRNRSARLARQLRLDPRFELQPADQFVVPIELASESSGVEALIASAHAGRPEISELSQEIAGLCLAVKKANVEPWIPSVAMTTSAGSFSGGFGSALDNRGGRSDIDLQALWQIENLGYGVSAKRSRASSRLAQRRTELADLRDQITADVVQAYQDVINYRQQIQSASEVLAIAESSFQRNLQRVRADEGLPIELQHAIMAKTHGLRARTAAVANYNRSQMRLMHAAGQLQL